MSEKLCQAKQTAYVASTVGGVVGFVAYVPLVIGLEAIFTPPLVGLRNFGQIGLAAPLSAGLVALSSSGMGLLCYFHVSIVCLLQLTLVASVALLKWLLLPGMMWLETPLIALGLLLLLPVLSTLLFAKKVNMESARCLVVNNIATECEQTIDTRT